MTDPREPLDLDALIARIREEAATLAAGSGQESQAADPTIDRERRGLPSPPEPGPAATPSYPRLAVATTVGERYRLEDLLCLTTDEDFLDNAYRALLGREPDLTGARHYLDYLEQWRSRLVVLHQIRTSEEGRRRGVRVAGLRWMALYEAMRGKRFVLPLLLRLERSYRRRRPDVLIASDGAALRRRIDQANGLVERTLQGLGRELEGVRDRCGTLERDLAGLAAETTALRTGAESLAPRIDAFGQEIHGLRDRDQSLEDRLSALDAQTDALQRQIDGLGSAAAELRGGGESLRERIDGLDAKTDDLRGGAEWLQRQIDRLNEEGERRRAAARQDLDAEIAWRRRLGKDVDFIRSDLIYHRTQVRRLLDRLAGLADAPSGAPAGAEAFPPGAAAAAGGDRAPVAAAVRDADGRLDGYYLAFEDEFRGSQDDIRTTQLAYLADIRSAGAGGPADPVLDLGCGRGEWLAILSEQGLCAGGVDTNAAMAELCRERGLEVAQRDALGLLAELPDASLGAVTAFHLIEHLPFAVLHDLVAHAHRALRPGGILILETPNPENVLVGSHTFYHDPTHRNPMTPAATRFLVRYFGFAEPEIRRLHPYPEGAKVPGTDPLTERVNGHLCGPQDFAVIACKPQDPSGAGA